MFAITKTKALAAIIVALIVVGVFTVVNRDDENRQSYHQCHGTMSYCSTVE